MGRLDSLAAIYRLAVAVSGVAYPIRFRWYRASTLDAAVELPGGRTVGIVGRGSPPTGPAFPTGCGGCARGRSPEPCSC